MTPAAYNYLKAQLCLGTFPSNNGYNTFSGCCGSFGHQEKVPRGINLSINDKPLEWEVPKNTGRYKFEKHSIQIAEQAWINIVTRHVVDLNRGAATPHGRIEHKIIPENDMVRHAYWESFARCIDTPIVYTFGGGAERTTYKEFFEEFKKEFAGKYIYWILHTGNENYAQFHKEVLGPGYLKLIHQTRKFNNFNYDREEDYLIGYLTQV